MANGIIIKTYNQILGDILRKIKVDTDISDLHEGSVITILAEAIAENDFDSAASILSVLQLFNLDTTFNSDLDDRGYEFGLKRKKATIATGKITITDQSIIKRSTPLYPIKLPPIKGATVIHVIDAQNWSNTGSLYIGRGTANYEGPISYSNIINNGSYYTIELDSALQNDHLISEFVIDSQGTTDRLIPSGTQVYVAANNQTPQLIYTLLRSAIIPAGEDKIEGIDIVAINPGASYNTGINTIVNFTSAPFSGAAVTNPEPIISGNDPESDNDFRDRIKNISTILTRGTIDAIISSIIGITDEDDNKQVTSAKLVEASNNTDISKLYIDDGTGFKPSYKGQSVDKLLVNATGLENFVQLSNYPVTRAQVVSNGTAPFYLKDGDKLRVLVDGEEEIIEFNSEDFVKISAASPTEVLIVINDNATLFNCRLSSDETQLILQPSSWDAEKIQVVAPSSLTEKLIDANQQFKFSTEEAYAIKLYMNEKLLSSKEKPATLYTTIFDSWEINTEGNLSISVDGTAAQDHTFTLSDFSTSNWETISIDDWANAFNKKFAGMTATAISSGVLKLTSNKIGSKSSLNIVGGSYIPIMFPGLSLNSVGQDKDFILNRQNGSIQMLKKITPGSDIFAGLEDAKGKVISNETTTGEFNLSDDTYNRKAVFIIATDGNNCKKKNVTANIGDIITVTNMGSDIMKISSSNINTFYNLIPGDYIYITNRGDNDGTGTGDWLDIKDCGLFKIISKGNHTSSTEYYVKVKNVNIVPAIVGNSASYSVLSDKDIQAFSSDTYPQVWTSDYLNTPANTKIIEIIDSINNNLINVKASIYKTNKIKITSTLESTQGSIFIPVSIGYAENLIQYITTEEKNPTPHVASITTEKELFSYFRRTTPVDTFLGRYVYSDMYNFITTSVEPGTKGIDVYAEELSSTGVLNTSNIWYDDIIYLLRGSNSGIYKSIKNILPADTIGTQFDKNKSFMDYSNGYDTFNIARPISLSSEDIFTIIADKDAINKKTDINMSRTGKVNSGSVGVELPTLSTFSADDYDNEPGTTFSTDYVWNKAQTGTEFKDYAVWFRARNIYKSQGCDPYITSSGDLIVRSAVYGPTGEKYRFQIDYPISPLLPPTISHINTGDYTLFTYYFGSSSEKSVGLQPSGTITITDSSSNIYKLTFGAVGLVYPNLASIQVGDIITIKANSGISTANLGTFLIVEVNNASHYIKIRNPLGCTVTTETITNTNMIKFYSLTNTLTSDIETKVNESDIIKIAIKNSGTIKIATKDETTSVGYDHDPALPGSKYSYISLWDGVSYIDEFSNSDPNFSLKKPFVLTTYDISIYNMAECPNDGTAETGEFFKLIPTTIENINHHFNNKAISQASVILNINITNDRKKIQFSSKLLGSEGAIEIKDNTGNNSYFYAKTDGYISNNYLVTEIDAFPASLNVGDYVKISSDFGIPRKSRLRSISNMEVYDLGSELINCQYRFKPILTIEAPIEIIIDHVSDYIYRWTHDGSTSLLQDVQVGDVLIPTNFTDGTTMTPGWDNSNVLFETGEGKVGGYLIVNVDANNKYIDVLNPHGKEMVGTPLSSAKLFIVPSPAIRFTPGHSGISEVYQIVVTGGTDATITTLYSNRYNVGDVVSIVDTLGATQTATITSVSNITTFNATLSTPVTDTTYVGGYIYKNGENRTHYIIEKLGYLNLVRLKAISGDMPNFIKAGVAVDDTIEISGSTFSVYNNGRFVIRGATEDSLIFENENAINESKTVSMFNAIGVSATWTNNTKTITGVAGAFKNVTIGDWVKKIDDPDDCYVQVIASNNTNMSLATILFLGNTYEGTSGTAIGVLYNQETGSETGVPLKHEGDIKIFEADSVYTNDTLSIPYYVESSWFKRGNTGTFTIASFGINSKNISSPFEYEPYIAVKNPLLSSEIVTLSYDPTRFTIYEGQRNIYTSIRKIENIAIKPGDENRKEIFLSPSDRPEKIMESYGTKIKSIGKIDFSNNSIGGIDGYSYYTGLLSKVQKTINGLPTDYNAFPGKKAVGSIIEPMPPLIRKITLNLDITTKDGINLIDISDTIKSELINYINKNLGVGDDVVIGELIVVVMGVRGVAAVKFLDPDPSEIESIPISDNEKPYINANSINIA